MKQKEAVKDLLVPLRLSRLFMEFFGVNLSLLLGAVGLLFFESLRCSAFPNLNHAIHVGDFHLHGLTVALACGISFAFNPILVNLSLKIIFLTWLTRDKRPSTQVVFKVFQVWVVVPLFLYWFLAWTMLSRHLKRLFGALLAIETCQFHSGIWFRSHFFADGSRILNTVFFRLVVLGRIFIFHLWFIESVLRRYINLLLLRGCGFGVLCFVIDSTGVEQCAI
jgi:hypothetical protein